ncbi:MAG: hypothetical protein NTY37_12980 [Methanothrix sp.]|nr:hypothetical protein [Methanothrix sp.]
MTLKAGSSTPDSSFKDSLAESIENALKLEWLAVKGELLPETGKADRRILFAAIAQGLLDYLKDNEKEFTNTFTGLYSAQLVHIESPTLKLTPSSGDINTNVTADANFFPTSSTNVTLIWDSPKNIHAMNGINGKFQFTFMPPGEAAKGYHLVEAHDGNGYVAFAVFELK